MVGQLRSASPVYFDVSRVDADGIYSRCPNIEQRLRGLHRRPRRTDELVPVISRLSTEAARLRHKKLPHYRRELVTAICFPTTSCFRGRRKIAKATSLDRG